MVKSTAVTVKDYLAALPPDRRKVIAAVRKRVRDRLPDGFQESINWGMITYELPLSRYPDTYNGQPLSAVALAAQKNYYALYLNSVYQDRALADVLRDAYKRVGLKLEMGKSCLRFRGLDDIDLDVVGDVIAATTPERLIESYEASRKR